MASFRISDLKAAFGLPGSTTFACSELAVARIGDYGQGTGPFIKLSTLRGKTILDLTFSVTATVNDGSTTISTPASVGHDQTTTYTKTTTRAVNINTITFSFSSTGKGYTIEAISVTNNAGTTRNNLTFTYNSSTSKYVVSSTDTISGTVVPSITYIKRNGQRKTVDSSSLDATSVTSTYSFKPLISITTTDRSRTESVTSSTTVTRTRQVPVYKREAVYADVWFPWIVSVWKDVLVDTIVYYNPFEVVEIYERRLEQEDWGRYQQVFQYYEEVFDYYKTESYQDTQSSTTNVTRSYQTSSASISISSNPDPDNVKVSDFSVYVASGSDTSTSGSTTVVYKLRWTPPWTGVQLSDSGSGASAYLSYS